MLMKINISLYINEEKI